MSESIDGQDTTVEPPQEAPEATQPSGVSLEDVSSRLSEMQEALAGIVPQQTAPQYTSLQDAVLQQPEPQDDWDGLNLDDQPVDNSLFEQQQQFQELINQNVQQAIAPLVQQMQTQQLVQQAREIEEQIPAFKDPVVVKATMEYAQQYVQRNGLDPSLTTNPAIIKLMYQAQSAEKMAAQEAPVTGSVQPQMSSAGVPQGSEENIAEQIVNAGHQIDPFFR